jgi:uracil-DNA glycosylase
LKWATVWRPGGSRCWCWPISRIAIVPVGFCYPGRGASGDLPPRAECAPLWFDRLIARLPDIRLTLLVGLHAQRHVLGAHGAHTLTATIRAWRSFLPDHVPLPHPSPRNVAWFKANPWFEGEVLPALRERVAALCVGGPHSAAPHRLKARA